MIASEQVLICPQCQQGDWTAELDRCPVCDGVRLSKALGIVRCSACGWTGDAEVRTPASTGEERGRLQDEVAAALDRVLRKPPDPGTDR